MFASWSSWTSLQAVGGQSFLLASAGGPIVRPMVSLARVQERRRAVALARHLRDEEGLSVAEIARRLGRAEATVKAYLYDPSQATKRPSWEREAEPRRSRAPAPFVLRLVAHPRTPARRRGARTTPSRRVARAVHCHRSVRELGGGRRGRLRRRLSVRASMPLTYERGLALDRL